MQITIKDVAKKANVSPSTVSRVMSNSNRISEATKEKVNKAIKELNYKPNSLARKLISKKSNILGVVIPEEVGIHFSNPFFIETMRGLSEIAKENNYYIIYAFAKDVETELKNLKEFTSNNLIDGVCLLTIREEDKCVTFLQNIEFPFVVIGTPDIKNSSILWVDNDNFKATFDVVDLLVKRGLEKIAYIGGNKHLEVSKNRLNGYKEALLKNKLPINNSIICEVDEFKEIYGFEAMEKILKSEKIDVVLTSEDLLAIGANRFLQKNNISDIKVIGFNNTPIVQYQTPPLSSIDINSYDLGYNAGMILINYIENKDLKENHKIINTNFIER